MHPLIAAVAVAALAGVSPGQVYVSLGDSVAWGYQPSNATTPSDGLQGFVPAVAGQLGATPINLGVPGETSASYFSGGEPGVQLNTNYAWPSAPSQAELFAQTVAAVGAGNVQAVTVSLGANDLIALTADFAFLFGTDAYRQQRIDEVVGAFSANLSLALAGIGEAAPGATVVVLNYYNPLNAVLFNADPTDDGLAAIGDQAMLAMNAEIAAVGAAEGVLVADVYSAFLGREDVLTHGLISDDIHPTDAGYTVIAGVVGAVIPGPGAAVVLAAAGGVAAARRRR